MIRIRTPRYKSLRARAVLFVALIGMAGCDGGAKDEWQPQTTPASTRADAVEAGYIAPPKVDQAAVTPQGLRLSGTAAPNASVRLGAPTGEIVTGQADAQGTWILLVPRVTEVRLYGLSMTGGDRTVQAQGYVLITPEGVVALLRAGAGTWRLAPASASPRILAVDVDPAGGAVISGMATPGAGLGVRIDRTPRAEGQASDDGRFFLSLSEPLNAGSHDIQVSGEGGEQRITVAISPAAPLTAGPMRAQRVETGWRIDWMTPGGGTQTTLIIQGASR